MDRTTSTGPGTDDRPASRIELRAESRPAEIARVRRAVEAFAIAAGLGFRGAADLGLCVNEALANVIRHAYHGQTDQPVLVTAERQADGAVRVTVRDWGNGVNPASLPPKPREPLQPGGVGLICLRELMDEATYTPQPNGGMLLAMVRRHRLADDTAAAAPTDPRPRKEPKP